MAATQTVAQLPLLRKSVHNVPERKPRNGVITLSGYGISVRVDRGHLILEDGIGAERVHHRLPRVDHGLKRLVVIGSDGAVSLSALRWLADQDASFVMLDRDGSVLMTTGPVRPSDVRLRRAQALTLQTGQAIEISRNLIDRKLAGQERVAIQALCNESAASAIRRLRSDLSSAEFIDSIRLIESQAARAYWSAWHDLPIKFPRKDLASVPEHWQRFGSRISSLTGSPRLATNPGNAILNYLYTVLESEASLAAATLGLDPGIGVLHADTPRRDSLACDLMEPIRPDVDAFVLNWLKHETLPRSSFFEHRDGNCRLMAPFAAQLSQTAPKWAHLIAPVAEWFAGELGKSKDPRQFGLPARLTQANRRQAQGGSPRPQERTRFRPAQICRGCGKEFDGQGANCSQCAKELRSEEIKEVARRGRVASLSAKAQLKRAATQRVNARARYDWKPSDQPHWLTSAFYAEKVRPALGTFSGSSIARLLKVSYTYADEIRKGRIPHPRHWKALAELAKPKAHPSS